jgi:hypothetical protein
MYEQRSFVGQAASFETSLGCGFREVLETIRDRQLFPLIDDLSIRLGNNQPILTAEMEEAAKEREQAEAKLYPNPHFGKLREQEDQGIPRLFRLLYDLDESQQTEEHEVELIRPPGGS